MSKTTIAKLRDIPPDQVSKHDGRRRVSPHRQHRRNVKLFREVYFVTVPEQWWEPRTP